MIEEDPKYFDRELMEVLYKLPFKYPPLAYHVNVMSLCEGIAKHSARIIEAIEKSNINPDTCDALLTEVVTSLEELKRLPGDAVWQDPGHSPEYP